MLSDKGLLKQVPGSARRKNISQHRRRNRKRIVLCFFWGVGVNLLKQTGLCSVSIH